MKVMKWRFSFHYNPVMKRPMIFLGLMSLFFGLAAARFSPEPHHSTEKVAATDSLLQIAYRLQGIPYRYGGKNESGFDCSGYTRYVYQQLGFQLNASAATQFGQGFTVHQDSLLQGDLVFFQHSNGRVFHVGMFVGEDEEGSRSFIHASSSRGVVVDKLDHHYFKKRWAGARRIFSP